MRRNKPIRQRPLLTTTVDQATLDLFNYIATTYKVPLSKVVDGIVEYISINPDDTIKYFDSLYNKVSIDNVEHLSLPIT